MKSVEVSIKYFPADDMVGDQFIKLLQDNKFRKFRDMILNIQYGFMIDYQLSTGVYWGNIKN